MFHILKKVFFHFSDLFAKTHLMQRQRVSHIKLFWKVTQPVYFSNTDICSLQTTPTSKSRNTNPHTKGNSSSWPEGQLFHDFTLTWKWLNIATILIPLFTKRRILSGPRWSRLCRYAMPDPWLLTQASFHLSVLSFFALWPRRVVLTHATLIISHSDIQIATEKASFAHVQPTTWIHQRTAGMASHFSFLC